MGGSLTGLISKVNVSLINDPSLSVTVTIIVATPFESSFTSINKVPYPNPSPDSVETITKFLFSLTE